MKYHNNVYIHRNQPFLPNFPKSPTLRSLPYCHLPSPSLRLLRWAIKRWSNTSLPQNIRNQCYPFYVYMEKLRVYFFVKWGKYLSILFCFIHNALIFFKLLYLLTITWFFFQIRPNVPKYLEKFILEIHSNYSN